MPCLFETCCYTDVLVAVMCCTKLGRHLDKGSCLPSEHEKFCDRGGYVQGHLSKLAAHCNDHRCEVRCRTHHCAVDVSPGRKYTEGCMVFPSVICCWTATMMSCPNCCILSFVRGIGSPFACMYSLDHVESHQASKQAAYLMGLSDIPCLSWQQHSHHRF